MPEDDKPSDLVFPREMPCLESLVLRGMKPREGMLHRTSFPRLASLFADFGPNPCYPTSQTTLLSFPLKDNL